MRRHGGREGMRRPRGCLASKRSPDAAQRNPGPNSRDTPRIPLRSMRATGAARDRNSSVRRRRFRATLATRHSLHSQTPRGNVLRWNERNSCVDHVQCEPPRSRPALPCSSFLAQRSLSTQAPSSLRRRHPSARSSDRTHWCIASVPRPGKAHATKSGSSNADIGGRGRELTRTLIFRPSACQSTTLASNRPGADRASKRSPD